MELLSLFVLAFFVEGLVEYVFTGNSKYTRYVALVLGVGLTLAYNVDLLAMVGLTSSYSFVGNVVSGLVVGRGSNYVNDFVSFVRSYKGQSTSGPIN